MAKGVKNEQVFVKKSSDIENLSYYALQLKNNSSRTINLQQGRHDSSYNIPLGDRLSDIRKFKEQGRILPRATPNGARVRTRKEHKAYEKAIKLGRVLGINCAN